MSPVVPGESECSRDKIIDTALAEESRMAARLLNDAEIEKYKRDFQVYPVRKVLADFAACD